MMQSSRSGLRTLLLAATALAGLSAAGAASAQDAAATGASVGEVVVTAAKTTRVTLTVAEGAGEHTHAGALGRAHPVMFDWLDTTLTA